MADEYSRVIGWLGASVPGATPPIGHKARLLARIQAAPQESRPPVAARATDAPSEPYAHPLAPPAAGAGGGPERRKPRLSPVAGGFVALAAVTAALVLLALWVLRPSQPIVQPGVVAYALQGQSSMKDASAVVLFDPGKNQATLVATGLQPLQSGQVYELWLLPPAGGAQAASTFAPDQSGSARHDVTAPASMREYTGVAVSLEQV